ncbi:DUF6455 family protein [uncultured Tateyamaria sp.]|uniref:DUF6455 family protein n=1 Tax=uncultured Tateyamaria sp. TaxID=455651 RepID=UPI00261DCAE0|nr:DUF6455 family protein [uncultured Tateyamaria sp.]
MLDNLEATIGAFEKRMAMRCKMLWLTGVEMPRSPVTPDQENLIRESVVRCMECQSADYCAVWLEAVDPGVEPPAFCPNAEVMGKLKSSVPGQ